MEDPLNRLFTSFKNTLQQSTPASTTTSATISKLSTIAKLRKRLRSQRLDTLKTRKRQFDGQIGILLSSIDLQHLERKQKLIKQTITATRRLQELLYECFVEMEKTRLKNVVLLQSQQEILTKQVVTNQVQWKIFLKRLEMDSLGTIKLGNIDPYSSPKIFHQLAIEFLLQGIKDKKISFDNKIIIDKIVCISNNLDNCCINSCDDSIVVTHRNNFPNNSSGINYFELNPDPKNLLSCMYKVAGIYQKDATQIPYYIRRTPIDSCRLPFYLTTTPLSSKVISWLLGSKSPIDSKIYYCIEEWNGYDKAIVDDNNSNLHEIKTMTNAESNILKRCIASTKVAFKLATWLGTIYSDPSNQNPSQNMSCHFKVIKKDTRHQHHYLTKDSSKTCQVEKATQQFLMDMPSVVVASNDEQKLFHFAPASLQQLLELTRYNNLQRKYTDKDKRLLTQHYPVPNDILENLYVSMPIDFKGNFEMIPLPLEAVDELVNTYVLRDSVGGSNHDSSLSKLSNALTLLEKTRHDGLAFLNRPSTHIPVPLLKQVLNNNSSLHQDNDAMARQHCEALVANNCHNKVDNINNSSLSTYREMKLKLNSLLVSFNLFDGENDTSTNFSTVDGFVIDQQLLDPELDEEKRQLLVKKLTSNTLVIKSGFCDYRGCLCKSFTKFETKKSKNDGSSSLYLCEYHSTLANQLSSVPGGSQEIKRHLPRNIVSKKSKKAVNNNKQDKYSSSLINELLNTKLADTIRGFCHRAAISATNQHGTSPDARYDKSVKDCERLQVELLISQRVLETEQHVSEELLRLEEIGYFPSDDLAAIRREYDTLDKERQELARLGESIDDSDFSSSNPNKIPTKKKSLLALRYASLIRDDSDSFEEQVIEYNKQRKWKLEVDLELEFCLRKFMILSKRRALLQGDDGSSSAGAGARNRAEQRLHEARLFSKQNHYDASNVIRNHSMRVSKNNNNNNKSTIKRLDTFPRSRRAST